MVDVITETKALAKACEALSKDSYIAVDTEFMRESTFWPKLCLIQVANAHGAHAIDCMAPKLDLTPFFELMADKSVMKVFHAARQDIEIVWNLATLIPEPVFDTQVAAMVCGYGDSISYEQLVYRITGAKVDKSSRFTDWSRRPLTDKQLKYALSDVTHLRDVYQSLKANLEEQGRADWVREEMNVLTSPDTYIMEPKNAWRRLKLRVKKPKELAVMMSLAEWREEEAQRRNVPRNRVIKDDAIYELAQQQPKSTDDLSKMRGLSKNADKHRAASDILRAVARGLDRDPSTLPDLSPPNHASNGSGALVDLLKVLLKAVSDREGVAPRVIATVDDLTAIALSDTADVAALRGWRRELFGNAALQLKQGKLGLSVEGGKIRERILPMPEPASGAATELV